MMKNNLYKRVIYIKFYCFYYKFKKLINSNGSRTRSTGLRMKETKQESNLRTEKQRYR